MERFKTTSVLIVALVVCIAIIGIVSVSYCPGQPEPEAIEVTPPPPVTPPEEPELIVEEVVVEEPVEDEAVIEEEEDPGEPEVIDVTPAEEPELIVEDEAVIEEEEEPYEPKKRPYEDSPYAENIDAALKFLMNDADFEGAQILYLLMLDYLQSKFDLDDELAARETIDTEALSEQERAHYYLHARLVSPGYKWGDVELPYEHTFFTPADPDKEFVDMDTLANLSLALLASPPGSHEGVGFVPWLRQLTREIQNLVFLGMYCDVHPIDETFMDALTNVVAHLQPQDEQEGNVSAKHHIATNLAAMSQWVRELGCVDAETGAALNAQFANIMTNIVRKDAVTTENGLRALAVLHYIGHQHRVEEGWVEAVANTQMQDGAWSTATGRAFHPEVDATVCALWTLLEDALPDVDPIPWLQ